MVELYGEYHNQEAPDAIMPTNILVQLTLTPQCPMRCPLPKLMFHKANKSAVLDEAKNMSGPTQTRTLYARVLPSTMLDENERHITRLHRTRCFRLWS